MNTEPKITLNSQEIFQRQSSTYCDIRLEEVTNAIAKCVGSQKTNPSVLRPFMMLLDRGAENEEELQILHGCITRAGFDMKDQTQVFNRATLCTETGIAILMTHPDFVWTINTCKATTHRMIRSYIRAICLTIASKEDCHCTYLDTLFLITALKNAHNLISESLFAIERSSTDTNARRFDVWEIQEQYSPLKFLAMFLNVGLHTKVKQVCEAFHEYIEASMLDSEWLMYSDILYHVQLEYYSTSTSNEKIQHLSDKLRLAAEHVDTVRKLMKDEIVGFLLPQLQNIVVLYCALPSNVLAKDAKRWRSLIVDSTVDYFDTPLQE
jgi:hypothetical protein